MKKLFAVTALLSLLTGCSSAKLDFRSVDNLDLQRFMGKWYVIAGRFTPLEKGAHNAIEIYTYQPELKRIDIDFKFNRGSLDGTPVSIAQKGWVHNQENRSHWKISPFWPLKLDYLVLAVADDYSWTAIGVPNQSYLWIMARSPEFSAEEMNTVMQVLAKREYSVDDMVQVKHGEVPTRAGK